ncbi:MAG: DUF5063 domain-containing protein [Paludibacteraceae bacterium]|nr:DUF5063 domain-containing protein [Paludibacteraceae bacterium]
MDKPFIYQDPTIAFVTVATRLCLLLEHAGENEPAAFRRQLLSYLPVLYAHAQELTIPEYRLDGEPERFVGELDYAIVTNAVAALLGGGDSYLDIYHHDAHYLDEFVSRTISEDLADIYQELKDMAANFSSGNEDVMNDAVAACLDAFHDHWGDKLLSALRAIHRLPDNDDND